MRLPPRAALAEKLDMHRRAVATFAKLLEGPPPVSTMLGGTTIGSGPPTLTAPAGSLYLRSDGEPGLFVNLNGGAEWAPVAHAESTR